MGRPRALRELRRGLVLLCVCALGGTNFGCATEGASDEGAAAAGASDTPGTSGTSGGAGSGGTDASGSGAAPVASGAAGTAAAGSSGAAAVGSGVSGSGAGGAPPTSLVDGGAPTGGGDVPAGGTLPVAPPVADDCITDVAAGDHTFSCGGIDFMVMVDERCTELACGLIVDMHGAFMSGQVMRTNDRLHELGAEAGYLVVHPTAPSGTWDLVADPLIVEDFMRRMIAAFHVEERRVHVTGFSMGSAMTFWFLCNRPELIASTGPVTGSSASQVVVEGTSDPCVEALDADWMPRVPILFMSGSMDGALLIEDARARADGIASRLGLSGGDMIDGDGTFTRKRWTGDGGMVLDFLEHDYSNAGLMGHCIPGGSPTDALFACTAGGDSLDWGPTILQWFVEHPKSQ